MTSHYKRVSSFHNYDWVCHLATFLLHPTLIIKNNSYQVNKLVYKQAGSCICTYLYALHVPWCIGLGSSAYISIVFNTDVLFLLIAIAAVDLISPSSVNY